MIQEYVVDGAQLECTMGAAPSKRSVPPHRVKLRGKGRANIGDSMPFSNIAPFGACKITSPPKPCTPACAKWISGKTDLLVDGEPALLNTDMNVCTAGGGIVTIKESGQ